MIDILPIGISKVYFFLQNFTPMGQFSFKGIKNMHKMTKIFMLKCKIVLKTTFSHSLYIHQSEKKV